MNKNQKILASFAVLAITIAVVTNTPYLQKKIKPFFENTNREVLAKVSGFYGVDQNQFLILKVKEASGLVIEIYQTDVSGAQDFKQKFELTEDSDSYVTLDKSSTNLALSDVDKDGYLDIIAPSVDRNGNLRLNTYRYNLDLQTFEPYTKPETD